MSSRQAIAAHKQTAVYRLAAIKKALNACGLVNVDTFYADGRFTVRCYGVNPDAQQALLALDPLVDTWRYTIADVYTNYEARQPRRRYCQIRIHSLVDTMLYL